MKLDTYIETRIYYYYAFLKISDTQFRLRFGTVNQLICLQAKQF